MFLQRGGGGGGEDRVETKLVLLRLLMEHVNPLLASGLKLATSKFRWVSSPTTREGETGDLCEDSAMLTGGSRMGVAYSEDDELEEFRQVRNAETGLWRSWS